MEKKFKAFFVNKDQKNNQINKILDISKSELMDGNVVVKVNYSSLNYKDGLAITGKIPVIKSWPMIPGVDFSGEVLESSHSNIKVGDEVILNGWGVGEKHYGGYSEIARVNGDWLIKLPKKFSQEQAMIIGSAGYTAMLCVMAIQNDIKPTDGEILVTGASGGVGSVAVHLLSTLGYSVVASTGKDNEYEYLISIGAKKVIDRKNLDKQNPKPLAKETWAGAIDSVGGNTLSNILSETKYGGVIASTGLAQSHVLNTTVFPFILRNITMKGIDSVQTLIEKRKLAWDKLAELINIKLLESMKIVKKLDDLNFMGNEIIKGKVTGRVVIKIS